jgi:hypothetical protein
VPDEVFGLDAAKGLNEFAHSHGIGRVSMWSLNRDITCGPNYVDVRRVSAACSGVSQGDRRFADVLAAGMAPRLSLEADLFLAPVRVLPPRGHGSPAAASPIADPMHFTRATLRQCRP